MKVMDTFYFLFVTVMGIKKKYDGNFIFTFAIVALQRQKVLNMETI